MQAVRLWVSVREDGQPGLEDPSYGELGSSLHARALMRQRRSDRAIGRSPDDRRHIPVGAEARGSVGIRTPSWPS